MEKRCPAGFHSYLLPLQCICVLNDVLRRIGMNCIKARHVGQSIAGIRCNGGKPFASQERLRLA